MAPSVVLRDPPPGILDVSMAVSFDQPTGDTPLMLEVGLGFSSGGKSVQFAGDERLTCDGTALSLKGRVADFQALRAPAARVADKMVRCDFTAASGVVSSVSLQVPLPPMIISPWQGAQVARGPQTLITYQFEPATTSMLGIVALAPSSPSPKALATLNTPRPLQATVDTRGFVPGAGSLVLTASLTPPISQTGTPFKSVRAFGTATTVVTVTWL